MCYAIPGKVVGIDGNMVTVNYYGETRKAINEIREVHIGDYVYAQGGYVITTVSPEEAESVLSVWEDVFFELQKTDASLSKLDLSGSVSKKLLGILDRASQELTLKNEELLYLLKLENSEEQELLYKTANFLRQKHLSNSCCIHGIIEITNY